MALYVYVMATGALYSWSPDDADPVAPPDVLDAQGMAVVTGLSPLDATHVWQESPPTVITVTAPTAAVPIATVQWILRLTPTEFAGIMSSTDPVVQQFVYALNHTLQINLSDPTITNGVDYLSTEPSGSPLIDPSRVAALLAAP